MMKAKNKIFAIKTASSMVKVVGFFFYLIVEFKHCAHIFSIMTLITRLNTETKFQYVQCVDYILFTTFNVENNTLSIELRV